MIKFIQKSEIQNFIVSIMDWLQFRC